MKFNCRGFIALIAAALLLSVVLPRAAAAGAEGGTALTQKYRKKITATPFVLRKSNQANDIDDLSAGVSRELLRQLESTKLFLVKSSRDASAVDSASLSQDINAVIGLATLNDSQFVISGEVIDAGSFEEGGYFGYFRDKKRWFEMEFTVFDGLTGAQISRHRIDEIAEGDVTVGREKRFASKSFFSTAFGQAIGKTIEKAAEMIATDLERLPFSAKVIRVADGQVFINAGATSLVAPGDKLLVYRKKTKFSWSGIGADREYGIPETPLATVSVVQVQPMFSISTVLPAAQTVEIEAGDIVRSDQH
jgi:hypothetical protein